MNHKILFATATLALLPMANAGEPKVVSVKAFNGVYPFASTLEIPFHGCVELDANLPKGKGEYWFSLDHLIADPDFSKIEVLVNSGRTILGARATFSGSDKEWIGERGYESRQRLLSPFLGGDGPPLSKDLPFAYDGNGFGDMVYTFDKSRNVSWRLPVWSTPIDEKAYIQRGEEHKRVCAECKNISTAPVVVLSLKKDIKTTAHRRKGATQ